MAYSDKRIAAMVRELDDYEGTLPSWEAHFIGDLIDSGTKTFTPAQTAQVVRIHKKYIGD